MSEGDKPTAASNRREHDRQLVCIPAYVQTIDSAEQVALIRDISLSGAYMLTRRPFARGERVELALHLTGDPDGPVHEITADVVRSDDVDPERETLWWYGVALRFDVDLVELREEIERLAALLAEGEGR